jgi:protein disulfide-isomerase
MSKAWTLVLTLVAGIAMAATLPYDADADAKADVKHTLAAAQADHRPVLVIFGANWCEDCRALDHALHGGRNADLIAREFNVVKVDVGHFDHNLDVSAVYGDPIKNGIPAAVILSPDNKVLYSTRAGELADARKMSDTGVYDFFKAAADSSRTAAQ